MPRPCGPSPRGCTYFPLTYPSRPQRRWVCLSHVGTASPSTHSEAVLAHPHLVYLSAHPSTWPDLHRSPHPRVSWPSLALTPGSPSMTSRPLPWMVCGHETGIPTVPHLPHLSPDSNRFAGHSTCSIHHHPLIPSWASREEPHVRVPWVSGGVNLYCSPGSSPLTCFLNLCGQLSDPQPRAKQRGRL